MKVFEIIAAVAKNEQLEILKTGFAGPNVQEWFPSKFSLEEMANRLQWFSANDDITWVRKQVEYVHKAKIEFMIDIDYDFFGKPDDSFCVKIYLKDSENYDIVFNALKDAEILKVPKDG